MRPSEMDGTRSGGRAFPLPDGANCLGFEEGDRGGMTLRDYFAGQALAAAGVMLIFKLRDEGITKTRVETLYLSLAEESYKVSDAMLKEREKK